MSDRRSPLASHPGSTSGTPQASWFGPHTSYQTTAVPATSATYVQQMADDLVQDVVNLNRVTF
jgi:hypothetical protein